MFTTQTLPLHAINMHKHYRPAVEFTFFHGNFSFRWFQWLMVTVTTSRCLKASCSLDTQELVFAWDQSMKHNRMSVTHAVFRDWDLWSWMMVLVMVKPLGMCLWMIWSVSRPISSILVSFFDQNSIFVNSSKMADFHRFLSKNRKIALQCGFFDFSRSLGTQSFQLSSGSTWVEASFVSNNSDVGAWHLKNDDFSRFFIQNERFWQSHDPWLLCTMSVMPAQPGDQSLFFKLQVWSQNHIPKFEILRFFKCHARELNCSTRRKI